MEALTRKRNQQLVIFFLGDQDADDDFFTLKLYYGGQWFEEMGYPSFIGGKWRFVDYCDKDRMSILDINQTLKKVTKKRGPMLYSYLEPMGDFKTRLRLVARDEDILCMCEWVPRFKVKTERKRK